MDINLKLIESFTFDKNIEVLGSAEATQTYGKTTFSNPILLDAALVIKDEKSLSAVLTLANQLKLNLYPISTNQNWGYGSFNPQNNRPNVLVDLGQLRKITPTSKELGLITIEPGVTQQQLYNYLTQNDWPFMVPVTGAGPSCSLVSNVIERGYGITPHNDHFYACTALKGYIPHPDLCGIKFESAISAFDKSNQDFTDKTYKWGLGPYIDGLFTQSNLGIVSEMTLRLAPTPPHFCAFYLQVFDKNKFEETVHLIQNILKSYSGIVGSINLMDLRRLISITVENPNGYSNNEIMTDAQVESLAKTENLPQWMVVGSIYGTQGVVKAVKSAFKQEAKSLGKMYFSDSVLIKAAKNLANWRALDFPMINKVKNRLNALQEGIDIMLGVPNQVALPLPYWRNPDVRPDKSLIMSPSKDECGLLWYAPLIKMSSSSLQKFVNFVREITPKYNIEPLITFTNLKHDCVDSTVPLVFNLKNKNEVENAHKCLNELITEGTKYGFIPYRLDTNQQTKLDKSHIFWQTTNKIKDALDPNLILSPGRYNPK